MFFGLRFLWATTVIASMTSLSGESGWFKTERPAPPIVSYAKDQMLSEGDSIPAASIACTYATTLATYKGNSNNACLISNSSTVSFLVGKAHAHRTNGGEAGVIVHNTHKALGISYITFLVGDWDNLKGQLEQILLQYHRKYQSVFPTVPQSFTPATTTSALYARVATSSTLARFSLPTQGVNTPVRALEGLPFDQIISGWDNKFDQPFKMMITREALWKWPLVWKDEQKYKPIFERLLHQFVGGLPKHYEESGNYVDRELSQRGFVESCVCDFSLVSFAQLPIAIPMFLIQYWNVLQPTVQQGQVYSPYDHARRDLRPGVVVTILTLSQYNDLERLKELYVAPLLQGVYEKISDMPLDVLFDAYQDFIREFIGRYGNSSAINREHLGALQRAFMDLLEHCDSRMEHPTNDSQGLWNRAAQVAGEQANLPFFNRYGIESLSSQFMGRVPLLLAPEVWQILSQEHRQRLFSEAVCSDAHIEFVKRYMNDEAINSQTKCWAYEQASRKEQRSSNYATAAASDGGQEKAPKIAALLREWAPS